MEYRSGEWWRWIRCDWWNAGQENGGGGGAPAQQRASAGGNGVSHLCFTVSLGDQQDVKWDTLLIGKTLFIEIPGDILPEGSRER